MPPPKLLEYARPDAFIGELMAAADAGQTATPLVDVYEGQTPEAPHTAMDGSPVHVYEFMPVQGDELDTIGQPYAVAAVEGVHRLRNGHTAGWLSFAVAGPETTSHTTSPNPVIEGGHRFRGLLHELTREEGVDRLFMRAENTNLTPEELRMLGFEAVMTDGTILKLELPADKAPHVATAAAA